jgi:hypothetical protein
MNLGMWGGKKLLGAIFVRWIRLLIFCFHIVVGYLLLKLYFMLIEFRMRAYDSAITCFHSLATLPIISPAILLYSEAFHDSYCKHIQATVENFKTGTPCLVLVTKLLQCWNVFTWLCVDLWRYNFGRKQLQTEKCLVLYSILYNI